ncbi:hypothetical protein [Brevundimonas sp. NIBR11]|uniref:hypothetical protein n=1 Tax=Brevundimonas sp. NIBR11 TaxID=3015999 RepID=UPI0022F07366|nr:hypothetical protein [Brevundimonas sp. NIBR11]WGM32351.1 hypothetical protein KKHFBJBL_02602 [Brevundimonas sp. NIBR11]
MTDSRDDAADIAWLRNLAAEGASNPMGGGSILMAAGLIFGVASIVHWSVAAGLVELAPQAFSILWLGAVVVFLGTLSFLIYRKKQAGGVTTAADRASRAAWSAVGWGIFALFSSIAVVATRIGIESLILLSLAPSIIMVFYGLGWAVSAAMTRSKMLAGLAAASFVAAPLLALLTDQPALYLAYAAALFLLMALPGYLLMRAAKRG